MHIEPYEPRHFDAVIGFSLRAWTPVFDSIQKNTPVGIGNSDDALSLMRMMDKVYENK